MAVVLSAAVMVAAILFVAVLLSTLIGGIVGAIVGMVFPFVIETLNTGTGLVLTGFEWGAVLGFVGSFFKTSVTKESK